MVLILVVMSVLGVLIKSKNVIRAAVASRI